MSRKGILDLEADARAVEKGRVDVEMTFEIDYLKRLLLIYENIHLYPRTAACLHSKGRRVLQKELAGQTRMQKRSTNVPSETCSVTATKPSISMESTNIPSTMHALGAALACQLAGSAACQACDVQFALFFHKR